MHTFYFISSYRFTLLYFSHRVGNTGGGQYVDGGGNTATNNEGGKDCEGVLAKNECELVFTTSDEAREEGGTEAEGLGDETEMPTTMTDSPTDDLTPATLDPTMFPSASPIVVTSEPTKTTSQSPSVSTTSPNSIPTTMTNVTLLAGNEIADEQAEKNIIELTNSSHTTKYLTLVNFNHEDGALGLCEGDCNKDNDCQGRFRCFKRIDNGGWRNMAVPGCEADENHPMRKVDYCYDPFASTPTEIGRGEPETDSDPVVLNGDTVDETPAVTPAPTVGSKTMEPSLTAVTDEPTTAEPSGLPTLAPTKSIETTEPTSAPTESIETTEPTSAPTESIETAEPTSAPTKSIETAEPTKSPSASPVSDPPTASPVTPEPTASPVEAIATRTSPTPSPTKGPTSEYIDNSEPSDPTAGYFNYDINSDFGPRKWHKVKPQKTEEYNYWKEFKDVIKADLDKNYCDSSAQQSPVDVFDAGGTCLEYHQIRNRVRAISIFFTILAPLVSPQAALSLTPALFQQSY